ncbi:hypothetical protein AOQ73_18315 [Bradyrhizobium pachyrhizi]|nr:hypothetical protein AOQ73_18315 [Bradyrhizobium pachyrhizi]
MVGAGYNLSADWIDLKFDNGTLVATRKRGTQRRIELQEPEHCKFVFTVDAGTSDYTTTMADFNKLDRIEVAPTISGKFGIIDLAGVEANAVIVHTRFGDQKSNKVQLNNLAPAEIDAFVSKVAEFQEKMCGVKVKIPGS